MNASRQSGSESERQISSAASNNAARDTNGRRRTISDTHRDDPQQAVKSSVARAGGMPFNSVNVMTRWETAATVAACSTGFAKQPQSGDAAVGIDVQPDV